MFSRLKGPIKSTDFIVWSTEVSYSFPNASINPGGPEESSLNQTLGFDIESILETFFFSFFVGFQSMSD